MDHIYFSSTQHFHYFNFLIIVKSSIYVFLVAGVIGAAYAVIETFYKNNYSGKYVVLVTRRACASPTPGLVQKLKQAAGSSNAIYRGTSNLSPAAPTYYWSYYPQLLTQDLVPIKHSTFANTVDSIYEGSL
ncbi:MAG: hypothetical protein HZB61_07210 [Nitrospirae bacterium]|nr:hypothetical protein [Nitrospirota bacterium]